MGLLYVYLIHSDLENAAMSVSEGLRPSVLFTQ
jgi:hypothetical protein